MPEVVYLSDLLGKPVKGVAGEIIGRLKDLIVHMSGEPLPEVIGLVLAVEWRLWQRLLAPAASLASLDPHDIHLSTSKAKLRPFARHDGEALLNKDVLDKQVIDINGRRVTRVNDLTLARADATWRLAGADISAGALLRRLGLRRLFTGRARQVIPWDAVQFFASEVPGVKIQLKYDQLAKLHPMDMAQLINELGYRQRSEVIAALDTPTGRRHDPGDGA